VDHHFLVEAVAEEQREMLTRLSLALLQLLELLVAAAAGALRQMPQGKSVLMGAMASSAFGNLHNVWTNGTNDHVTS
jgi:hypothetical protein